MSLKIENTNLLIARNLFINQLTELLNQEPVNYRKLILCIQNWFEEANNLINYVTEDSLSKKLDQEAKKGIVEEIENLLYLDPEKDEGLILKLKTIKNQLKNEQNLLSIHEHHLNDIAGLAISCITILTFREEHEPKIKLLSRTIEISDDLDTLEAVYMDTLNYELDIFKSRPTIRSTTEVVELIFSNFLKQYNRIKALATLKVYGEKNVDKRIQEFRKKIVEADNFVIAQMLISEILDKIFRLDMIPLEFPELTGKGFYLVVKKYDLLLKEAMAKLAKLRRRNKQYDENPTKPNHT